MRFRAAIVLCLTSWFAGAALATESLQEVLSRLDRAASSFKGMTANVRWVAHTAVIDQDEVDTGTMVLKRSKNDTRMLVNIVQPDAKTVALHDKKLEIYYPKMRTVEEYDIGKHREAIDQFLLLGFGTSGKELASAYKVRVAGTETVAGQKTIKLELIPKSAETLQQLKKVEMWIPEGGAYPVQQKFYLSAGDYKLVTYTDVKLNPPLSDSDLKLKVPKEVKRVYPQK
jgi:outer membrane lipoprotein-sorting protein